VDGEFKMPKNTHESITIRADVYKIADFDANSEHRSLANYIQHLILQERDFKNKTKKIRKEIRRE